MNGLLAKWLAVQGNSEQNYVDFRTRMLLSLPDEPMTAKIVLVRQHLAEVISLGPAGEKTPEALLSAASKRAKMLAIPAEDVSKEVMAPFVDMKQKDAKAKDTPKRKQEPDAPSVSKYRPRAGQNKCPFCPVDLCKATAWAQANNDKDVNKILLDVHAGGSNQADTALPKQWDECTHVVGVDSAEGMPGGVQA